MQKSRKLKISDFNPHLTCILCSGYLIDATTIIECLHSFCRGCIVKYLESNKYCPICDVQVHKTKPLLNIRSDFTLQNIVYKLVPGLFQNEMCRRRDFYSQYPDQKPSNSEISGEVTSHIYTADENISICLEYHSSDASLDVTHSNNEVHPYKRYLRCPAAVSILHLQKLIRAKYGLSSEHRVDVMYKTDTLSEDLTLMDIAYIYVWKRKGPLHLTYQIFEAIPKSKPCNISEDRVTGKPETPETSSNKKSWKEVQLQISENGIMSVTNIDEIKPEVLSPVEIKSEVININKEIPKLSLVIDDSPKPAKEDEKKPETPVTASKPESENKSVLGKHKLCDTRSSDESSVKILKSVVPIATTKTLKNIQHLSKNHPLKIHSQATKNTNQTSENEPTNKNNAEQNATKTPTEKPKNTPVSNSKTVEPIPTTCTQVSSASIQSSKVSIVSKKSPSKTSTAVGYKTLRDPPKAWNPQISKPNLSRMNVLNYNSPSTSDSSKSETKSLVKPAKFFKMRNNMPRYLGNPASGVKPMYQVCDNNKSFVDVNKNESKKNFEEKNLKKESSDVKKEIVKIDPKTLRPLVDKKEEPTPNSEVIINQSIVPIFNPLRSKVDRRSPKMSYSESQKNPNLKQNFKPSQNSSKYLSSPTSKKDKPSLNFTPRNPFIPNLASPNLAPNHFLYPNFSSYDPRIMNNLSAYHNLPISLSMFYSQPRLGYPGLSSQNMQLPPNLMSTLNLELNKNLLASKIYEAPSVAQLSPICDVKKPLTNKKSDSPRENRNGENSKLDDSKAELKEQAIKMDEEEIKRVINEVESKKNGENKNKDKVCLKESGKAASAEENQQSTSTNNK